MSYTACVMILGILFWVLAGLCVVSFMAWIYVQIVYYKWNKEDRERQEIERKVEEGFNTVCNEQIDDKHVNKTIDSVNN